MWFMKAIVVLGLCVVGLGFYRSWFSLSSQGRDAGNNKVNINNEEVKVAVKPKKEVKITVWLHADVIKSGAEAQVQKMKDLYSEFEKLCCPSRNAWITLPFVCKLRR